MTVVPLRIWKPMLGKKQASNIPVRKDKAYWQKPAILTTSGSSLSSAAFKSWIFWVFVQILGFHCSFRRVAESVKRFAKSHPYLNRGCS
jgi:hypothetical protein